MNFEITFKSMTLLKKQLNEKIPIRYKHAVYLEDPESPFHHQVKQGFQQLRDEDQVHVSVLSLFELYYAVALRKKEGREQFANHTHMVIKEIKKHFKILPLSGKEASIFGEIKALYKVRSREKEEKQAIKKHDVDFILASTAIEYGLTIVSNDDIFQKIKELFPELQVENWQKFKAKRGCFLNTLTVFLQKNQ